MKESLKCKNMNRTLSNNKPTRPKKPTIAFETKYLKGQKIDWNKMQEFFLSLKMPKVEEMNTICRRCKILEKQTQNLNLNLLKGYTKPQIKTSTKL